MARKKKAAGIQKVLTLEQYFAGYPNHPCISQTHREEAAVLIERVNVVLRAATSVRILNNPVTGGRISGQTNGGWRPLNCPVGAANSKHKTAQAVDIYDPYRELAAWVVAHLPEMEKVGLWMEDFRWTPSWVHFQSAPPGSGKRIFVPSGLMPLAQPVPGQVI